VAIAAAFVLIPHLPLIQITVYVEAFNGFVLPIVLGFLLVMINDKRIVGEYRNSWIGNAITLALSAVIVLLGVWMAGSTLLHAGGA
jgi:Mn2+/Fe2+ NRAMP family transporter